MIFHHNKIPSDMRIGITIPLKYSDDYTFIPVQLITKDKKYDCIFQTPKLFIPYGVQTLNNEKQIMDLSFQNKENDTSILKFMTKLKKIHCIFKKKYSDYTVHPFLKETNYDLCMRLKVDSNSQYYNHSKQRINRFNSFNYGVFIIQFKGIWINNNDIWFQWCLLQSRIEGPTVLKEYSFIEESKYDRMLKMGVPKEAIELKKQIDSKIPPPPPLPMMKTTKPISKIRASDLQKVILRKTERIKKPIIQRKSNHFEPPSLEELQITISKLKKSMV